MRLNRLISGLLVVLMLFGLAGCGTEQPKETTADASEGTAAKPTEQVSVSSGPIQPLAFVSDTDSRFKKQEEGFVTVYKPAELDDSIGRVIDGDL